MKESYYSLGIEMSWVNAAFFILLVVGVAAGRSIKARKLFWNWGDVAVVVWNVLVWVFRIPFAIALSLSILFTMAPAVWRSQMLAKTQPEKSYWTVSLAISLPLIFMAWTLSMFRHTITLSDTQLADEGGVAPSIGPRAGLRVDATGSPQWIKNRKSWNWTTLAGDDIAPGWMGQEVFVGPHGFISGDDLGRRVAEWADTKVKYRWLEKR